MALGSSAHAQVSVRGERACSRLQIRARTRRRWAVGDVSCVVDGLDALVVQCLEHVALEGVQLAHFLAQLLDRVDERRLLVVQALALRGKASSL